MTTVQNTLSDRDRRQLEKHGISEQAISEQLAVFARPPYKHDLVRPCTVGDGVLQLDDGLMDTALEAYRKARQAGQIEKFVPASGAASRMFKDLKSYQKALRLGQAPEKSEVTKTFFEKITGFAFAGLIAERLGVSVDDLHEQDEEQILDIVLEDDALGYGQKPKGLLVFHDIGEEPGDEVETAFRAHLVEAAQAISDDKRRCRLHFTISPEHRRAFDDELHQIIDDIEGEYDCLLDVSFSTQSRSTDTVAVDSGGELFREESGALVLRPGGHGALLGNLADRSTRYIFIKNIDNIMPDHRNDLAIMWQRYLIGILAHYTEQIHAAQKLLDENKLKNDEREDAIRLLKEELGNDDRLTESPTDAELREALNRPIRVAGVVRDEGATGGKPFWVSRNGKQSPQIVESAEVDLFTESTREVWEKGTHFNPVKLAVCFQDYRGMHYDLNKFINHDAYFVAEKSKDGRTLRALERPGLWNGSMADWHTIFVEVPVETFNPVKAVTDLLNPAHSRPEL